MAIDPVCGMKIDEHDAPATTEYEGVTYCFCSQVCKQAFLEEPQRYVTYGAA